MEKLNLIKQAHTFSDRIALRSGTAAHSYADLLSASEKVAATLLLHLHKTDLDESRVAFMMSPSFGYAAVQWGIWRSGGVAVPLALSYPAAELEYAIQEAACSLVICEANQKEKLHPITQKLGLDLVIFEERETLETVKLPVVEMDRRAMILFTSGTTSKPKGVVSTHLNIEAQITSLVKAWKWTSDDWILNVLPLHHTHGLINMLGCALWSGACCEFMAFDPKAVWKRFSTGNLSLFMAVPTIYHRLIKYWNEADMNQKRTLSSSCYRFRLMVSGSAALPVSVLGKWEAITGQRLLERYGMTELGMALSNPYSGKRKAGFVGMALPGVEVKLLSEKGGFVEKEGETGEIVVRGANVFLEYWNRADATRESFTAEGWFKTGDIASVESGYFRIHGRSSVDIIKSGGYKISALQIEEVLLAHPAIEEVAVVGMPHEEWGEQVCAALVMSEAQEPDYQALRAWCKEKLAPYKVPGNWITLTELPRNALGKVVKNKLKQVFAQVASSE